MVERNPSKELPNENVIVQFLHCQLCAMEIKAGADSSPRNYARFSIGFTKQGLQVWCIRHDRNVMHIDFERIQHPANMTRKPLDYEVKTK